MTDLPDDNDDAFEIPEAILARANLGDFLEKSHLIDAMADVVIPHRVFDEFNTRLTIELRKYKRSAGPSALTAGIDSAAGLKPKQRESKAVLFYGRTGAGKSHFLKWFANKFQPRRTARGWVRDVVLMNIPSGTAKGALLSRILTHLGAPTQGKRTVGQLETAVRHHLREQRVRLLILDEFNHMIDEQSQSFQFSLADDVKEVLNDADCRVAYCGLESALAATEVNPQLSRRKYREFEIRPYPWDGPERADYLDYLGGVADWVQKRRMFDTRPPFDSDDFAERLHRASDGLVGITMNLLILACEIALVDSASGVRLEHLAQAFDEQKRKGVKVNPFVGACPKSLGVPVDEAFDRSTGLRNLKTRKPKAEFTR